MLSLNKYNNYNEGDPFNKTDEDPVNWKKVTEKARDITSDVSKVLHILGNKKSFVVLDTETTGFCANRGDKIIEVAFQKYEIHGDTLREGGVFHSYVDPQRFIPWKITDLTGITDEDIQNKPFIEELLPEITRFMGENYIVGHNVSFDFRFLNREMDEAGYPRIKGERIVDTLKISRIMYGRDKRHRLADCARREKINKFSQDEYHSAVHDVKATAEIFFSMIKKLAEELE